MRRSLQYQLEQLRRSSSCSAHPRPACAASAAACSIVEQRRTLPPTSSARLGPSVSYKRQAAVLLTWQLLCLAAPQCGTTPAAPSTGLQHRQLTPPPYPCRKRGLRRRSDHQLFLHDCSVACLVAQPFCELVTWPCRSQQPGGGCVTCVAMAGQCEWRLSLVPEVLFALLGCDYACLLTVQQLPARGRLNRRRLG